MPTADANSETSTDQVYYPPGMEIPLTETEIPGSAYFTGPNGERIDTETFLNEAASSQEGSVLSEDLIPGLSPSQFFTPDGIYDGTLSFPMGTFPTAPFGERIISEVPETDSASDETDASEIEGDLQVEGKKPVDVTNRDSGTSEKENGVPVDEVIRPDETPEAVEMDRVANAEASGDNKDSQSSVIEDSSEKTAEALQVLEKQLAAAAGEKKGLNELLEKASQENEALTEALADLKAAAAKKDDQWRSELEAAVAASEKAEAESEKSIAQLQGRLEATLGLLKQAETRNEETVTAMREAKERANQAIQAIQADKEIVELNGEVQSNSDAAANTGAASLTASQASDDAVATARDAKIAAEQEVSRKLKELEARKKAADAAQAAEDALGDIDGAGNSDGQAVEEVVLSLDDRIKQLRAKRDQQIAEFETRIRAKQQRTIDKLLEEGKTVDSDEVKAAVDNMKAAIATSEDKLRSRFQRRLKRLKASMKKP